MVKIGRGVTFLSCEVLAIDDYKIPEAKMVAGYHFQGADGFLLSISSKIVSDCHII